MLIPATGNRCEDKYSIFPRYSVQVLSLSVIDSRPTFGAMDAAVNIYNTSVIPPPDGIVSNFDRTLSSVQIATIVVFAVTYFLATLSLGIRYATSVLVVKEWELDVGKYFQSLL